MHTCVLTTTSRVRLYFAVKRRVRILIEQPAGDIFDLYFLGILLSICQKTQSAQENLKYCFD